MTVASLSVRSHVPVAPWEISGTMRSKKKDAHREKKKMRYGKVSEPCMCVCAFDG